MANCAAQRHEIFQPAQYEAMAIRKLMFIGASEIIQIIRNPYLTVILFLIIAPFCEAKPGNKINMISACKSMISNQLEANISESLSDEESDYREYGAMKFGVTKSGQAFVQLHDEVKKLEDVTVLDGKRRRINLTSETIALERSQLYARLEDKQSIYCLVAPFSGIGSSRSFQRFALLIAVRESDKSAPKFEGAVIRREAQR